jgi:hypothetical protein
VEVIHQTVIKDWNVRLAATFPSDQLMPGDKIVEVNRKTDIGGMDNALLQSQEERVFMVVMRSELH